MEEKIVEIITNISAKPNIAESQDLLADGILDSFSVIRLVDELEEEFDIDIKANQVVKDNFQTVKAIAAFVSAAEDE